MWCKISIDSGNEGKGGKAQRKKQKEKERKLRQKEGRNFEGWSYPPKLVALPRDSAILFRSALLDSTPSEVLIKLALLPPSQASSPSANAKKTPTSQKAVWHPPFRFYPISAIDLACDLLIPPSHLTISLQIVSAAAAPALSPASSQPPSKAAAKKEKEKVWGFPYSLWPKK